MLNKLFSSIVIVTSAFTIIIGQTSEKKENDDKAPRAFSFMFDGDDSYLGVQTEEVTKDNFSKFGLSGVRGVAVGKVSDNSPASAAGIQTGDVILRFNGEEVTGARKLTRLIGEVDPDHQARITISRNGREQEITATMSKRPMTKFDEGNFSFPVPPNAPEFRSFPRMQDMPQFKELPQLRDMPQLNGTPGAPQVWSFPGGEGRGFTWKAGEGRMIGVGVTPLTKQLAQHYGVDGGVLVSEVREGSPAAKAGLKAGDVITEVEGKAVKGQFDIVRTINEKKDGDITVTFVRDGKRSTVNVTPEKSKNSGFAFESGDEDNG
jgi:serine protease Do